MRKEIEISNLPEGYKAIAFRIGRKGETIIDCGEVVQIDFDTKFP
jgi:hypothetical protein